MADLFDTSIDKIPFNQFEVLGMSRKHVLSLHPITLAQLLTGKKTSLITFKNIDLQNGMNLTDTAAKLSLERQPDSSLALKIHTRKEESPSVINGHTLTNEEKNTLLDIKNPVLPIDIKNAAGTSVKTLVQYDKELNDYTLRSIQPSPNFINGVELTDRDKEKFSLGDVIYNKEFGFVRKDLNNPLGYIATSPANNNVLIFPSNNKNEVQQDNIINVASSLQQLSHLHKPTKDLPYHYSGDAAFLLGATNLISNSFKRLKQPQNEKEIAERRLGQMSLSQEIRQIRTMGLASGVMPLSAIFAYDFIREALRQRPKDLNKDLLTGSPRFAEEISNDVYAMIPDKIKGETLTKPQKHILLTEGELSIDTATKLSLLPNGKLEMQELNVDQNNEAYATNSFVAENEMEYKSQGMEPVKILALTKEQRQYMQGDTNHLSTYYGLPPITASQAKSIPDVIDGHKLAFNDKLMLYDGAAVVLGNASYHIDKKNDTIEKSMMNEGIWQTDRVKEKDVTYNRPGEPDLVLNLNSDDLAQRYQPLDRNKILPYVEISYLTTSQQAALNQSNESIKSELSLPALSTEQLQSVPNSINNNTFNLQDKIDLLYGNDVIKNDIKYTVNENREIEKFTLDKNQNNTWKPDGSIMNHEAILDAEREKQKYIPSDKMIVDKQIDQGGRTFIKEDFLENNKAFEHDVNLKDLHQESFKEINPSEKVMNEDIFTQINKGYDNMQDGEGKSARDRDLEENNLGMDDLFNERDLKENDKDKDNSRGMEM